MSLYDLHLHVTPPKDDEELLKLWEKLKHLHTLVPHTERTFPPASWQHLTTGYDAGYYGYLWSMVRICKISAYIHLIFGFLIGIFSGHVHTIPKRRRTEQ